MGSPETEDGCDNDEGPQHLVMFANPTLAELLTPLLAADPFSTMRASVR